jgi:energy-coupling factor transporter ATP-binding protein EcfA2
MPDPRSPGAVATRLLLERPPRLGTVRLGVVDGPSGSGKSTFTSAWAQAVRDAGRGSVAVISSDLIATWDDPFGWWAPVDGGVLRPLADGKPGRIRLTDWTGGDPRPGDWVDVPMVDVLILEGVSCGRRALQGRASVVVWVSLSGHRRRLDRAVARDGESSRAFLATWQDAEDAFFAADRTAERADLLLVDGAENGCA